MSMTTFVLFLCTGSGLIALWVVARFVWGRRLKAG